MINRFTKLERDSAQEKKPPLFRADIVLQIPNVVMKPSLEDIQAALNKCVQIILKMTEAVPQWEHLVQQQRLQQKVKTRTAELSIVLYSGLLLLL